jgi:hypothetical protein
VKVTIRTTRRVDHDKLESIVGPRIMAQYDKIGIGTLDAIRSEPSLTDEQRSMISGAVISKHGMPTIKVTKRGIDK